LLKIKTKENICGIFDLILKSMKKLSLDKYLNPDSGIYRMVKRWRREAWEKPKLLKFDNCVEYMDWDISN